MSRSRAVALPVLLLMLAAGCTGRDPAPPFTGWAEAELVYVGPTAGGVLTQVAVHPGDAVRAGQPLFALDADAEALARDAARAREERAAAQLANLRSGRRPLELRALDEQLAQARAALAASQSALERNRALVAQGFVAAQRLDEFAAARDRDAARVKEVQAQRAFAAEAARHDEIAAAAAEARGTQADAALAQWREGQRARTAPADAVVFDVLHREGEFVAAGAPVVVLLPPKALKLRFYVPEPELARAAIGAEVWASCDGCAAPVAARIRWVSPQAEFTPPVLYGRDSRAKLVYAVDAEPASGSALKPGQPVDVRWK